MSRSRRARPRRTEAARGRSRPAGRTLRAVPAADARAAVDDHVFRLRAALAAIDASAVSAIGERLGQVLRAGGLVLLAGNGGSAATASHMAVDLGKAALGRPPRPEVPRLRTIALSDPAVVTAWANDEAYDAAFAEQITTLARPGDAVVLLSVSGRSPNVVAAARAARAAGAAVIALLGGDGGTVRPLADHALVVPSDDYQVVEDAHLAVNHMVTTYLRLALGVKAPRVTLGATTRGRTSR